MATEPNAPQIQVDYTVMQMCTADGTPYQAWASKYLWVHQADAYEKTDGNKVTPLLSGEIYYKQLAGAIAQAQSSICMLGWQINWDVMLTPGLRLYDAILKAVQAKPALKVYVLPWDDSAPLNTFDDQTVAVLTSINKQLKGKPQVFARLAPEHPNASAGMDMFYSHHQKQVVIDNQLAFMGGIDVAYGRRDGLTYPLNATGRLGNDAYNGCVPHVLSVSPADYVNGNLVNMPSANDDVDSDGNVQPDNGSDTARANLATGQVELPESAHMLDASRQPRMPWQDVHLMLEGPAVSDLASNFVLRWNMACGKADLRLPAPSITYAKAGGCCVQMLRSASSTMVALEAKKVSPDDQGRVHSQTGHNHIYHAMVGLIEHAEHFIYIENQFFVSAFGHEKFGDGVNRRDMSPEIQSVTSSFSKRASMAAWGDSGAPPSNVICEALGTKLHDVIMDVGHPPPDGKKAPFHIYITLPVHPEGQLNDPSVMTQVHYTMQTLVYGTQSLLNRTRRAIKARLLFESDDPHFERVFADANTEYESVPVEHCWAYITLLNLRNWDTLGGHLVTEQIYVHTKVMVVDDRYAIVGSANINDRSQLGNRDSELAVLVMDTDFSYEDIGCPDGPQVTRKFARELRMGIWNKLFGNTGKVRPAGLDDAIKRPVAQGSWEDIRRQAAANTAAYEAAFAHIPANRKGIWPTAKGGTFNTHLMPFSEVFWKAPPSAPGAAAKLAGVMGYITLLPWEWTIGQNNNSGMHSALFVKNENRGAIMPSIALNESPEAGQGSKT